jgi:TRAP transporter 4TM/12TM fusion protein
MPANINQNNVFEKDLSGFDVALISYAVVFWLGVIYYATTQQMPRGQFGVAFLGGAALIIVLRDFGPSWVERNYLDIAVLGAVTTIVLITTVYFFGEYDALVVTRIGFATDLDYQMAIPIVTIIMYLTYREFGLPFVIVILFTLFYGFYGSIFPGVFSHGGLELNRILQVLVTDMSGIYGRLNRLVAAWIALFLLFAGLMQAYGAFDLVLRVAFHTGKYIKSGVAQTAVIASMIIGSINGSATANTGITGSITIPLMKESGMEPRTAAAIESVASNGGQLLPPVMGASAFLMAGLLGLPFIDIIIAGTVPALIFYASVVAAVHYTSVREIGDYEMAKKRGDYFDDTLSKKRIAIESARFLLPIFVLVYLLGVARWTIQTSALLTCLAMFITGISVPILETPSIEGLKTALGQTLEGAKVGAIGLAPIAIVIAGINAMVDVLITTGMPNKLTLAIVELSGGVILLAIIAGIAICIILGLGMPTSAAYLIVALLVAPTYISQFAVPELASHFFVFYAASLATITPPIATGIVVAAGIAGANFWSTASKAIQMSVHLFLLPVMFIYNPQTISATISVELLASGALGTIGAVGIIYGLNKPRFELRVPYRRIMQGLYVAVGTVTMVHPNQIFRVAALIFLTMMFLAERQFSSIPAILIEPGRSGG